MVLIHVRLGMSHELILQYYINTKFLKTWWYLFFFTSDATEAVLLEPKGAVYTYTQQVVWSAVNIKRRMPTSMKDQQQQQQKMNNMCKMTTSTAINLWQLHFLLLGKKRKKKSSVTSTIQLRGQHTSPGQPPTPPKRKGTKLVCLICISL